MNTETDSACLLAEFVRTASEAAFGELVHRHIDLVYSAARRRCAGDATLAEDVTQTVFTDLARKARSLPRDIVPAGWLYRHTCFVASTAIRSEVRRRNREETAVAINQLNAESQDAEWSRVAPVLEDAMLELPDRDRDALVLRYFEEQPFGRVGAALGVTEDAARMRVDRALERLRELLGRRGVTSAGAALATTLTAYAVTPAPAMLAPLVIGAAGVVPAAATAVASWWSLKTVIAGVSGAAAVVAIFASVMLPRELARHRAESEAQRAAAVEQLRQAREASLEMTDSAAEELDRLRAEHLELLRLRGEVTRLRSQLAGEAKRPTKTGESVSPDDGASEDLPRETQVVVEARIVKLTDAAARSFGMKSSVPGATGVLTESQATTLLRSLEQSPGVKLVAMPKVTTPSGRQAQLTITANEPAPSGPAESDGAAYVLDVTPMVDARTRTCILSLRAGLFRPKSTDDGTDGGVGLIGNSQAGPGPDPKVTVVLPDGHSVVWTQPAGGSWNTATGTAIPYSGVMVIVTTTCLDAAGNRLFHEEEVQNLAPVAPGALSAGNNPDQ